MVHSLSQLSVLLNSLLIVRLKAQTKKEMVLQNALLALHNAVSDAWKTSSSTLARLDMVTWLSLEIHSAPVFGMVSFLT